VPESEVEALPDDIDTTDSDKINWL